MKEEINLDLLKLHTNQDKDPRSWILAEGKDLRKEINKVIKEINLNKIDLTNKIAKNLNLKITLKTDKNPANFYKEIINKRKAKFLTRNYLCKKSKTSGYHWNKLENGKHIPSCQKLKRIYKELGNSKIINFNCKNNDHCLKKLIIVYQSLYENKKQIPLILIKELLNVWKQSNENGKERKTKIIDSIDFLIANQHRSQKIKATSKLNTDLAKIIGAFCADGNFYPPDMIRWEEEHFSNMEALARWIKNCFRYIEVKPEKRGRNSYTLKFRSKIVARYLEIFFKFKPKTKQYTVRAPKIIRHSPFHIQKAFALGALTFDGCVSTYGRISFGVISKKFRDDVASIMKKETSIIIREKSYKGGIWSIDTNKLTKNDKKFLNYFEKDTIKWLKLKEHLFGFNNKVDTEKEAIEVLSKYFYKKREPSIQILLKIIKQLNTFDIYQIVEKINVKRTSILKYINLLKEFNILKTEGKNKITYSYNDQISTWNLPILY